MNLGELRATLQAYGYAADTSEAQTLLLNAVYRDVLSDRRWPWLLRQATVPVPAGVRSVDLASIPDLRDVDALHLDGFPDPQYQALEALRAYTTTARRPGRPTIWTQADPITLELYPAADRDYTAVVDYVYQPPMLADDADVPVIPVQHHDVLVYGAIARMGIRERDANVRQLMQADYDRALMKLRATSGLRQRQSTSQVVRSGIYDNYGWVAGG